MHAYTNINIMPLFLYISLTKITSSGALITTLITVLLLFYNYFEEASLSEITLTNLLMQSATRGLQITTYLF